MANSTEPFAQSVHGTNPQYLMEKITRLKIYNCNYWKEECFGLTAKSLVDKALRLRYVGGTYGGNLKPSDFLCLVLKMLQLQPEREIVMEYIKNENFKYLRALGAFYLRMTGKADEVHRSLEPLLYDFRPLVLRSVSGWSVVHMDDFIDSLLREELVCDISLPHMVKRIKLEELQVLPPRKSHLEKELAEMEELEKLAREQEDDEKSDDDGDGKMDVMLDNNIVIASSRAVESRPEPVKQPQQSEQAAVVFDDDDDDGHDGGRVSGALHDPAPDFPSKRAGSDYKVDRNDHHSHDRSDNSDRRRRDYRSRSRSRSRDRRDRHRRDDSHDRGRNRRDDSRERDYRDDRRRDDRRDERRDDRRDERRRRSPNNRRRNDDYNYDHRDDRRYHHDAKGKRKELEEEKEVEEEEFQAYSSAPIKSLDDKKKKNEKRFDRMFGKKDTTGSAAKRDAVIANGSGHGSSSNTSKMAQGKVIVNDKGEKFTITAPEGSVEYWNQIRESLGMKKLKT